MENSRILVVEDEAVTAMDIKSRLVQLRYNVLDTVFTGEESISLSKKLKPDLILMDIVLRGKMDGTEAAKIITKEYHIPVVFLTAYNDSKTFNRAKVSLPYGYLTKPFETRELQIAIELALYRHDMELKLAIAEQRYSTLMENASCGIFVHDRNGIVFDINRKGADIFGDQKSSIIGKDFRNYVPPAEREYAHIQLNKLVVEKHIGPNEGHILQPNGNVIDVEFSSACVNIEGEEVLLSVLTDVTQKNKLRAQALLSDKLATVGTLAAGIIHEINNPLNWILTNLSVFKENLASIKDIQKQKKFLPFNQIIDETIVGAKQIRDIVHALKGFTRVDDAELSPIDINQLLSTVINMVSAEIKSRARIETDFQSNIPLILMSSSKLQQVFLNLIMNAIQAFPDQNQQKNIIQIKSRLNENRVCVDISDTGTGISLENLARIFDPFFTTKPSGIGTGLGLSICYDILHCLGGEINVQSTLGKGTTFSVYLPLQVKIPPAKDEKSLSQSKSNKHLKILIIDDEPFLLTSLKRILDPKYTVTTALGGRNALEILDKNADQFDVIISDLYMPDVSGADVYRYISGKYPGLENKIIFVTGSVFSKTEEVFFDTITNPKLKKPFEQDELFQAISQLCP